MIHRIELSANDSALVAKGCPLRVDFLGQFPKASGVVVVMTRKSWDQIRATYDSRLIRVTLGA